MSKLCSNKTEGHIVTPNQASPTQACLCQPPWDLQAEVERLRKELQQYKALEDTRQIPEFLLVPSASSDFKQVLLIWFCRSC